MRRSIACVPLVLSLACAGDPPPPSDAECDTDPLLAGCTGARPPYAGPTSEVEIVRDADGVPHVFARTDADAMFASGYMQATDRLFQMDLARRRALGRRAEILGADYVDEDRLVRVVDLPRWGRTNEAALFRDRPELWALAQAWTEGVNRAIREARAGGLPAEFGALGYEPEEWSVSDAFTFARLVLFGNANQIEYTILSTIVLQVLPELDEQLRLTMPIRDSFVLPEEERPTASARSGRVPSRRELARPLPRDVEARLARFTEEMEPFRSGGSNNWAVDGRHTANGRPLIAGDPHQPLVSPSLFWMHHLSSDESLDVIGWSFVGGPLIQLGHNRDVAWTATTTYGDMMDMWDVRVADGVAHVADRDVPVRTRSETIGVAGAEDVVVEVVEVPGHGVLLPDDLSPIPIARAGRSILFRWTGFGPTHEFEAFWGFDTAASRDDVERAVDRNELGLFNIVSADADGISYRASPRIPDRGAPSDARPPYALLDGDDASTYWTGAYLDGDRLPHSRGGARGWIASANNDPFGLTADGRLDGDPFYYGMLFDPGLRSARIESELARLVARGDVSADDMIALQDDTYTILADDYLPALEEAWATVATDPALADLRGRPELDALVASLLAWDRRMERGSREALAFDGFMFFLARRILSDDLSIVFTPIMEAETTFVFKFLSNVLSGRSPGADAALGSEGRASALARALEQTHAWLSERAPAGDETWGDVHGTRFPSVYGDRLEGGWVATDGSVGTVNVSNTVFFEDGEPRERLDARSGSIYRMVAGFREDGTPEALVTVPRGVSGDPESPHWSDLHEDWIEHRPRRLRFTREEIEADPFERMVLAP